MSATLVQICFFRIHHDKASKIGNEIGKTEERDIRYMGAVSQSGRKKQQKICRPVFWNNLGNLRQNPLLGGQHRILVKFVILL